MKPKSDTRCIVYYKGTQNKYVSALKLYELQTAALQACRHLSACVSAHVLKRSLVKYSIVFNST